jgi:hypothetical protein
MTDTPSSTKPSTRKIAMCGYEGDREPNDGLSVSRSSWARKCRFGRATAYNACPGSGRQSNTFPRNHDLRSTCNFDKNPEVRLRNASDGFFEWSRSLAISDASRVNTVPRRSTGLWYINVRNANALRRSDIRLEYRGW